MHASSAYRRVLRVSFTTLALLLTSLMTVIASKPSAAVPSRSELEAAEQRLMELEKDFELVVERYNAAREELTRIQARIAVDEVTVRKVQERMRVNEAAAELYAEELYKGGSSEALEVLLSSNSLADVESRLEYLRSSESAQAEVFERLAVDRQLLEESIARLEQQRRKALATKERLGELRADIETKVAAQRDEIERLTALIEAAERREERRREAAAAAAQAEAAAPPAAEASSPPAGDVSAAPAAPAPAASSRAGMAVQAALAQVGKPYQWGGAGPSSFDCSGLTMWAWSQAGVSLPHSSAAQYAATPRVSQSDWQPGDLLFYGSPIHHMAMYIGGGQIVEAPYTGATVRVASAHRSDYAGAGRPGV